MKFVFDTEVILKFYLGEKGAEKVGKYLENIASRYDSGYISYVNLAEFYYILHRKSNRIAEEKVSNLLSFGIKPVDVKESWKTAAMIKAEYRIPLGDAFAAAAALTLDAVLLTGRDSDFAELGIKIERI